MTCFVVLEFFIRSVGLQQAPEVEHGLEVWACQVKLLLIQHSRSLTVTVYKEGWNRTLSPVTFKKPCWSHYMHRVMVKKRVR